MTRRHAVLLILTASLSTVVFGSGFGQGSSQKPIRQVPIHTEGGRGVPPTLEALVGMSDLVVVADVVDAVPDDKVVKTIQGGSPFTIVKTVYSLSVVEVVKTAAGSIVPTSLVDVELMGGLRDRGQYIDAYVDDRFPQFVKGERYILFLKDFPDKGRYLPVTSGADSAFLVRDSHIIPRGRSPLAQAMAKQSAGELVSSLKRVKGGVR